MSRIEYSKLGDMSGEAKGNCESFSTCTIDETMYQLRYQCVYFIFGDADPDPVDPVNSSDPDSFKK